MRKRLQQVWVSPEAKRHAKMLASKEGKSLKEWLDTLVLDGEKGKKRGDDYRFF